MDHDREGSKDAPGRRSFMGMKFHDRASSATAWRVSLASVTLCGLAVVHCVMHGLKGGKASHSVPNIIVSLILPLVGWCGASRTEGHRCRARLLWVFHFGNMASVLIYGFAMLLVFLEVSLLYSASPETMCNQSHEDPAADLSHEDPAADLSHPAMFPTLPTLPPKGESYHDCLQDVLAEKQQAPGLMAIWAFLALPYCACGAFAAYYGQELYFQLRIRELTVCGGSRGEGGASHEVMARWAGSGEAGPAVMYTDRRGDGGAFAGVKFHDEEIRTTAGRVSCASVTLGATVGVRLIVHFLWGGNGDSGYVLLIIHLIPPLIGWCGASHTVGQRCRTRLLWTFHIWNVASVLFYGFLMLLLLFLEVSVLDSSSPEAMCNRLRNDDPSLPAAGLSQVLPTLPPRGGSYEDCLRDALAEKEHAPGRMAMWECIFLSYWACSAFAAYYGHELYFQLRTGELLLIRRSTRGDGGASHETEPLMVCYVGSDEELSE